MNPLQIMMERARMEQEMLAQDPNAPQTMGSNTLGAMLGSIQSVEPHVSPVPSAMYPAEAKQITPQFTQALMQMLAQGNRPQEQMPSLAALLSGRV
jgi:regulator of sirC expression with transglutaminase-like and TPR domain